MLFAPMAWGQETTPDSPVNPPAKAEVVVRDVNVFVLDAFGSALNTKALFKSTWPPFALSTRPAAAGPARDLPSPTGLITFEGEGFEEIDVLLEVPEGRCLAAWPPSRVKRNRILWQDLKPAASLQDSRTIPETHWLLPLRKAARLPVKFRQYSERFLLYDIEVECPPMLAISIEGGEASDSPNPKDNKTPAGQFKIENRGGFPIFDVTIIRPEQSGKAWRVWHLPEIAGVESALPAPRKKRRTPAVKPKPIVEKATDPESLFVRKPGSRDLPPEPVEKTAPDTKPARKAADNAELQKELARIKQEAAADTRNAFSNLESVLQKIDNESKQGRIPGTLNARVINGQDYYNAVFVDGPLLKHDVQFRLNATQEEHEKADADYRKAGYGLVHHGSFTDVGETERHQAVWLRVEDPEAGPSRNATIDLEGGFILNKPGLPDPLRAALKAEGLGPDEIAHVGRIVRQKAFDPEYATVLFRFSRDELDYRVPLELTPEPERLVRGGLVILLNADPSLPAHLETVIARLGNPRWKDREAAMARLRGFGIGARSQLEKAVKNDDPEIAWRAEILIEELRLKLAK